MANTDKNILITPNNNSSNDPKIVFSGANTSVGAQSISLNVYPTSNGTLSFDGSAGNLFTIKNDLSSGYLYQVNDMSAVPTFDITSASDVRIAPFYGTTLFGPGIVKQSNPTSGEGYITSERVFRLTAAGTAFGPTIGDFYGTLSTISLEAASAYEITFHTYFLKTTAGTLTWTLTASSAPTSVVANYIATPVTGTGGAGGVGTITSLATAATAFAATSSLTTATNHAYTFKAMVLTNAACTFKLRLTQSAGTVTPRTGSYYTVKKIGTTLGTFS